VKSTNRRARGVRTQNDRRAGDQVMNKTSPTASVFVFGPTQASLEASPESRASPDLNLSVHAPYDPLYAINRPLAFLIAKTEPRGIGFGFLPNPSPASHPIGPSHSSTPASPPQ